MSKLLNKVFFNKFKVKKIITVTHFSLLYEGINIKNKEPVVIKLEDKLKHKLLENEAYFLYYLKGFGIPKIISFGKNNTYNILIEELLGPTLYQLWNLKTNKKEYKLKTICMIALQILDRLEFIHSKNIVHRDVKPNNFIIGRKDKNVIYLIDFGFSGKYKSSRTGKHIKYQFKKLINGALKYLSINAIKGYEQSRRDDLESLGYMLIHLITDNLPWLYIEDLEIEKPEKIKQIYKSKLSTKPELLCKGLPEEFTQYIKYCRNLYFEQEPDYNYLRSLFNNILIKNHQKNDLNFYWIIDNNKLKNKNKQINDKKNQYYKKRGSSHQRLYIQIKDSLEQKKLPIEKYMSFDKVKINDLCNNLINYNNNINLNVEYNIINNIENNNNNNINNSNILLFNLSKTSNKDKQEFKANNNFINSFSKINIDNINNTNKSNIKQYESKINDLNIEQKNKNFNNNFYIHSYKNKNSENLDDIEKNNNLLLNKTNESNNIKSGKNKININYYNQKFPNNFEYKKLSIKKRNENPIGNLYKNYNNTNLSRDIIKKKLLNYDNTNKNEVIKDYYKTNNSIKNYSKISETSANLKKINNFINVSNQNINLNISKK